MAEEDKAEAVEPEADDSDAGLGDDLESSFGANNRILNQDEIDSLLGFDADGDDDGEKSGIKAIINSALVNYERLPMLEVVFDRLVRMMTTSLRNFTSDNVEVALDNITSVRFGDYLNSIPLPAILSVFRAVEWDNYGLITVDSSLIYSIVDVLLGGRRGTAAMRIEGRPYTTIERNLVERMVATWKTVAGGSMCCCPTPHWSPFVNCCCRCSWVRSSVVTRSGKTIWPPNSGRPTWIWWRYWTSKPCRCRRSCA